MMTTDLVQKPQWHVQPKMRARARALRREMTLAERVIWYAVRAHRLNGMGFRRQTPVGPFIVNFVSHAAKLVIEIDGGQHFEPKQSAYDARRDAFLQSKGYRVLRFNNHDVMTNRDGVLTIIATAIGEAGTPSLPSPASGGGAESAAQAARERAESAS